MFFWFVGVDVVFSGFGFVFGVVGGWLFSFDSRFELLFVLLGGFFTVGDEYLGRYLRFFVVSV